MAVDVVLSQQHPSDPTALALGSPQMLHLGLLVSFVGVDLLYLQHCCHHVRIPCRSRSDLTVHC